jgi:16S rRNA (cytosine967-C5)-methyltransferase
MDIVLVDAPCTGSGVWRRRPDAKWRVREEALGKRVEEQHAALDQAAGLVKPGGRLAYVTCSLFARENGEQVTGFLERFPDFELRPYEENWQQTIGSEPPASADGRQGEALLLTPASHGTDGFFVAVMDRRASP